MQAFIRSSLGRRSSRVVGLAAAIAFAGVSSAAAANTVYVQTNDPAGNKLVVYKRASNGSLQERARISTGGMGLTPSMKTPITDSDGSVELTNNGNLLFVTNAGSNTISSFAIKGGGLPKLVDQQGTGGQFPLSSDSLQQRGGGGLLYTVNYVSGDIFGFRYAASGKLTPIQGSLKPLSTTGPGARPASIRFLRGSLVVSLRDTNTLDVFSLNSNGTPNTAVANTSHGLAPFGMTIDKRNRLYVTDSRSRSVSVYTLGSGGKLNLVNSAGITGKAPCWVSLTPNGRYAYTSDGYGFGPAPVDEPPADPTGPGTLTMYAVSSQAKLTYLGNVIAQRPGGLATDSAVSPDGRWFDVIKPDVLTGMTSIETYTVRRSGGLIARSSTAENLPVFSSGMAQSNR